MGYQLWSVVAFEQPTAAKWNILGTNDAEFDSLIADDSGHTNVKAETSKVVKQQTLRRNITSSDYKDKTVIIHGWDYIQGDTTLAMSKAISFGVTFSEAPTVVITYSGARAGSAPTLVSDLTGVGENEAFGFTATAGASTTTGFTAVIGTVSRDGNAATGFANTSYFGFSWIAMGRLA